MRVVPKTKLDDIESICSSDLRLWSAEPYIFVWGQRIELRTSTLRSGGQRLLMLCPECRRQCAKLFNLHERVVCRICTGLKYASQSRSWERRNLLRITKLAEKLKILPFSSPPIERPCYMHRSRFRTLLLQLQVAEKERMEHFWPPHVPDDDSFKKFHEALTKPPRFEIHSEVIVEYRTIRRRSGQVGV